MKPDQAAEFRAVLRLALSTCWVTPLTPATMANSTEIRSSSIRCSSFPGWLIRLPLSRAVATSAPNFPTFSKGQGRMARQFIYHMMHLSLAAIGMELRFQPDADQMPSGSRTRWRLRRPFKIVGIEPTAPAFLWRTPPRRLKHKTKRAMPEIAS